MDIYLAIKDFVFLDKKYSFEEPKKEYTNPNRVSAAKLTIKNLTRPLRIFLARDLFIFSNDNFSLL